MGDEADLDDILNSALDDIGADDGIGDHETDLSSAAKAAAAATAKSAQEGSSPAKAGGEFGDLGDGLGSAEIEELMKELQGNPEFAKVLEETFAKLSTGEAVEPGSGNPFEAAAALSGDADDELDQELTKTLGALASAAKAVESGDVANAEAMGEEIINQLLSQFEKMGQKEDFDQVVDGMMKQLLSKEVIYEPMKQITDRFPEWLAVNEAKLPKEEYERYGKLYQCYQRCVAVLETDPDNSARIAEIYQDMQPYGKPPADLIQDLAPGLSFDEGGMPSLPNMGPGMLPPGMDPAQGCAQQ